MSEKLKGHVTVSRTINLGNYNSTRVEAGKEYYQDDKTSFAVFMEIKEELEPMIREASQ